MRLNSRAAAILAFAIALLPIAASAELVIPPPPSTINVNGSAGGSVGQSRGAPLANPAGAVQVPTGPTSYVIEYPAIDPVYLPQTVAYDGPEAPGTIIVDTINRFLYLIQPGGMAIRYGVGVGRPGFEWSGVHTVTRKAEWPDWRPPPEMRARQPGLPDYVPGGPANPLGARALYLGSTLYRIHGSNEPWTIGQAVSSGCIRMRNEDVIDLYNRVPVGARVVVI